MVRSKRLQPISHLAQKREKAAAIEHGKMLDRQNREEQKLQQLEGYRLEYLNQMEAKVKQGISGTSLQQYHLFLGQIDAAIKQQHQVIFSCKEELIVSQNQWESQRSKAKAIDKVIGKMQSEESKVQQKKEANISDEMSTQAFLRNQYR